MFYVALILFVLLVYQFGVLLEGRFRSKILPPLPTPEPSSWPRVSIIIAARDEEADLEPALQSILNLDYPDYEIVAVNDRSRDGTGAVLERMSQMHPRLKVITITELPQGWLGKNHALSKGCGIATGELLLFTDADIVFEPATLKRAVAFLLGEPLDHLSLSPFVRSRSLAVNLLVTMFVRNFVLFIRPWKARDPKSPYFVGIGAFNLIRRSVYDAVGGHEPIRLRPDDDIKLGKLIKQAGYKQDLAFGADALSLEWYPTVGAMIRGLEKNVLAGVDYRIGFLLFGMGMMLFLDLGPWALLASGEPWTMALASASCLLSMGSIAIFFPQTRMPLPYALLTPILGCLICYTFLRSAFLTLWRGGIYWRETFYPLAKLRENRV